MPWGVGDHVPRDRVRARTGARPGLSRTRRIRRQSGVSGLSPEMAERHCRSGRRWGRRARGCRWRSIACRTKSRRLCRADARVRTEHHDHSAAHQDAGGKLMRAATTIEASSFDHWPAQRDFVVEAEKLGLDIVGWPRLGARTRRRRWAIKPRAPIGCCSVGVIRVGTRTPVAVAQTAITLSNLSGTVPARSRRFRVRKSCRAARCFVSTAAGSSARDRGVSPPGSRRWQDLLQGP